ncbi:MAG TPA: TerB family tellurite resistance protein, partial [Bacteroidales bacterium]|nr:TerB family tellurite resistance protein [Bacteroidales bacterium]
RARLQATQTGDFNVSLLILVAAVMKANKRVVHSELDYIRKHLLARFGTREAQRQLLLLRQFLSQEIDISAVCQQINRFMIYSEKLQLLHFLFGISAADGRSESLEISLLQRIATWIGVKPADAESIKAMFVRDSGYVYRILEITPEATDEEVKKAFRSKALKYHPDKVSHLGEEIQKAAKEKFQDLNAAYNEIRKQRQMA